MGIWFGTIKGMGGFNERTIMGISGISIGVVYNEAVEWREGTQVVQDLVTGFYQGPMDDA